MTPDFTAAIGAMAQLPDWFLWRLTWDAEEGKYMKYPCALSGTKYKIAASDPENRTDYATAVAALAACNARATSELRYALGFWMTKECGYWFLDIDKCLVNGQWSSLALDLCARFPGAMIEQSSSGNGLHVIGQTEGDIPAHGKRNEPMHLEFYTSGRGIAFGNGVASGSADSEHDDAIHALITELFKPAPPKLPAGKRPEWRGPADDDALIERMLNAKPSAEVAFGGKASLRDLWEGHAEHDSHSDMSLACHLAFWTGCDEERMERLMRRSGLYREKWDGHRTYLRELTIARACAQCTKVYQQPE
jgi:putative DNA primase/helicase